VALEATFQRGVSGLQEYGDLGVYLHGHQEAHYGQIYSAVDASQWTSALTLTTTLTTEADALRPPRFQMLALVRIAVVVGLTSASGSDVAVAGAVAVAVAVIMALSPVVCTTGPITSLCPNGCISISGSRFAWRPMSNRRHRRTAVIGHQKRIVLVAAAPRTLLRLVDDLQLRLGSGDFVLVVPLVDQHAADVVVGATAPAPLTLDLDHSGSRLGPRSACPGRPQHAAVRIVLLQAQLLLLRQLVIVVVIVVVVIVIAHLILRVQAIAIGIVVVVIVIIVVLKVEIEDGAASAGSRLDAMATS